MKQGRHGAYDWRQSFTDARGAFHDAGNAPYTWREGIVRTSLGYVHVYSEPRYTQYRAMIGATEYCYTEEGSRSDRGLTIMAAKFIRRLYEQEGE